MVGQREIEASLMRGKLKAQEVYGREVFCKAKREEGSLSPWECALAKHTMLFCKDMA